MRIDLRRPYKSIWSLTAEELPDFVILIGRNGAGKSQLLEALEQRFAVIPNISVAEIEKYDMGSFRTPNASEANRHSNQFARDTADAYLLHRLGGTSPIERALKIFNQFASEIEQTSDGQARDNFVCNLSDEIRQVPDFDVFAAQDGGSPYKQSLYARVLAPLKSGNAGRRGGSSSNQRKSSFDGNQAALLSAAMKLFGKLPHELTRDDIMRASHYGGEILSNSISEMFATYKVEQFIWAHKRIESEHVRFNELLAEYRTNNPPPWETLRAILSDMRDAASGDGLFNFDFSDPEGYELHIGNYEQFSFKAEMTNRTTGAQYELDSLSSGERVLMALCLASFNQYFGRRRPKLLLLDELDTLLHPSMVAALVSTLKNQFVSKGTKVLMTSHSPMTVASLGEADIFRAVRTGGHVSVSRTTKSEAINELSDGLATVDVGLRIAAYDEAKVTILTEGHNAKHLKRWVDLHFPQDVHVFEGLESYSSDGQLLTYGRLLGRVKTNMHFVIVWDCDSAQKADALRQELPDSTMVTPFVFKRRQENSIARNGIENNYEEEILKPFSITKSRSDDGTILGHDFHKDRKTEFANHVLQQGTLEDFTHFQDLRAIISGILGLKVNL